MKLIMMESKSQSVGDWEFILCEPRSSRREQRVIYFRFLATPQFPSERRCAGRIGIVLNLPTRCTPPSEMLFAEIQFYELDVRQRNSPTCDATKPVCKQPMS